MNNYIKYYARDYIEIRVIREQEMIKFQSRVAKCPRLFIAKYY